MTQKINDAAVQELKRIAAQSGGVLKPRAVVDAARADTSPLHSYFEWDDSKAAETHRIWQARQVISVAVDYQKIGNGEMVETQVFVSLTTDRRDEGGYRVVTAVMSDEDLRRQLLVDARGEMIRFKEKYRRLSELADVFKAIEDAVQPEVAKAS